MIASPFAVSPSGSYPSPSLRNVIGQDIGRGAKKGGQFRMVHFNRPGTTKTGRSSPMSQDAAGGATVVFVRRRQQAAEVLLQDGDVQRVDPAVAVEVVAAGGVRGRVERALHRRQVERVDAEVAVGVADEVAEGEDVGRQQAR